MKFYTDQGKILVFSHFLLNLLNFPIWSKFSPLQRKLKFLLVSNFNSISFKNFAFESQNQEDKSSFYVIILCQGQRCINQDLKQSLSHKFYFIDDNLKQIKCHEAVYKHNNSTNKIPSKNIITF